MDTHIYNILGQMQDSSSYTATMAAKDLLAYIHQSSDSTIKKAMEQTLINQIQTNITYHREKECSFSPVTCPYEQKVSDVLDLISDALHRDVNFLITRSRKEILIMRAKFAMYVIASIISNKSVLAWFTIVISIIGLILRYFN